MGTSQLTQALKRFGRQFWREDSGQDLIEYCLLLAFIVMCAIGLINGVEKNTSQLWSTLNVGLSSAQAAAS